MRSLSFVLPALLLAACGGDDGPAEPALVPGGGVRDPGIDGAVNVFVIDEDSDQAIANATIRIGEVEGTTDTSGLFVFDGVTGKQTITARAAGYAPAMWVGVDGANVTIPLTRTPTPSTPAASALLSGSITGWDALPAPAAGHARAALITFAQDPELGSTANDLTQPPPVANIPANACVRIAGGASPPCAWRLNARAGTIGLGLIMVDIDSRGTAPETDDVTTITGFSIKQPITVVAGTNQSGVMIDAPPASSTVTATIDFGTPPAGLTQVAAVPGLDLGANGVFRIGPVERAMNSAVLPNLTAFPGTSYELLGVAQEPVDDGTQAISYVRRRNLTSPSALATGEWLAPPTGLASDRATASFARGRAEGPYIVEFNTSSGQGATNRALSIAILDDSSQVTLPTAFAPLPSGNVTMSVTTLDTGAAVDLRDFAVEDLVDNAIRFAGDSIELR